MTESSGNPLLLRLFQSHHFTSQLCIAYLHRYSDDIGIQHTLCALLLKFPYEEIEFFLPELVHLSATKCGNSTALADLIVFLCRKSSQFALMSFWLYQCYLNESAAHPNTKEFQARKRMYNKVQQVVFGDIEASRRVEAKLIGNMAPNLLLAGLTLASIALPSLHSIVGPVALAEAKPIDPVSYIQSSESDDLDVAELASPSGSIGSGLTSKLQSPLSEVLPKIHPRLTYSHDKTQFLKTYYFRQEAEFLLALQDISTRLTNVPRAARLSALRAELTLLNQDLPANVNVPGMTNLKDSYHCVVRINPIEASVLNSAERVPYIIMVEVLKNRLSFDPKRKRNQQILNRIRKGEELHRKFDLKTSGLSYKYTLPHRKSSIASTLEDDFEEDEVDLGDVNLANLDNSDCSDDEESIFESQFSSNHSPIAESSRQNLNFARKLDFENPPEDPTKAISGESNLRKEGYDHGRNDTPAYSEDFELALATHMRAAATMLAQLDEGGGKRPKAEVASIKAKIITEMQNLEEQRLSHISLGASDDNDKRFDIDESEATSNPLDLNEIDRKRDHEDPSAAIFEENWSEKKERVRLSSPYGHLPDWDLISVIVKTGSDLRQEAFACQLIYVFKKIWDAANVNVWVRHMRILVTGESSGLIETVANAISMHSLKKTLTKKFIKYDPTRIATIYDYFLSRYGPRDSSKFFDAQTCFIESLAGYSVICYLLQLKDRHNGNILVDSEGHIVHIDFGFLLSNTPGKVGFESAPFKLTFEYLEIIGDRFQEFSDLFKLAFKAARKHYDDITLLVKVMGESSRLPCYFSGPQTYVQLHQRFQLQLSDTDLDQFLELLINKSNCSVWTRLYDQYQMLSQGIY